MKSICCISPASWPLLWAALDHSPSMDSSANVTRCKFAMERPFQAIRGDQIPVESVHLRFARLEGESKLGEELTKDGAKNGPFARRHRHNVTPGPSPIHGCNLKIHPA